MHCIDEMGGFQRAGEEPVLPHVPHPLLLAILLERILGMGVSERQSDGRSVIGNNDQMNVIGHEAPGQEAQTMAGRVLLEEFQVAQAITVGKENVFPVIASLSNVVRDTWRNKPWAARH